MSSTRTPGIRIDNRTNCLIIDKEHHGIPIYVRLGVTDQERAEQRLAEEIQRFNGITSDCGRLPLLGLG
jgi:hypothetical protein